MPEDNLNKGSFSAVKFLIETALDLLRGGDRPFRPPLLPTPTIHPMTIMPRLAFVLAVALVPALSAHAQKPAPTKAVVNKPLGRAQGVIEFVKPWTYSDVQITGMSQQDSLPVLLPDLGRWLVQEVADLLPVGTTLKIRINNIDDAGHMVPSRTGIRTRIVDRDYPAIVDFDYVYTDASNRVLKSGHWRFTNFSHRPGATFDSNLGAMPTVKDGFERWLRQTFVARSL